MKTNNLETLLNSYLEKFRRIARKELGDDYIFEFSYLLSQYKKENPEKALNILNEYRKIRYEMNNGNLR